MMGSAFNAFASTTLIGHIADPPVFQPRGTIGKGGTPIRSNRLAIRVRVPVAKTKVNPRGCIYVSVTFLGIQAGLHHSAVVAAHQTQKWVIVSCEYNQWKGAQGQVVPTFLGHSIAAITDGTPRQVVKERTGYEPDTADAAPDEEEVPWDADLVTDGIPEEEGHEQD